MASSLPCSPGDSLGMVAHGKGTVCSTLAWTCARLASGMLTGALCQAGCPRDLVYLPVVV